MPPHNPKPELKGDAHTSVAADASLLEEQLRSSFVEMVNNTLGGERTSSFTQKEPELGFALGAPAQPPTEPTVVPSQIAGRFTVRQEIGRGGFGTVYLAHDESLDRDVAIKVPHEKLRSDAQLSAQCLREARLAAKLRHPSIVTIFDISEEDGHISFIVQEFVHGATLYELISKQRFSVKQTILLVMKVAEAIAFAHARGVYHRDLKPANLMVDESGGIRVLDFGLAVDEEMQRSARGQVAGTIAYMSPEQIEGRTHHLDGRTDIWSLGVIFYELLTGRRPFRGNTQEVSDQVIRREAAPPRQFLPTIPKRVETCCLKCLTKSVSNRYATATDLLEDLKEIIESESLPDELPTGPPSATPQFDTARLGKDTTKNVPSHSWRYAFAGKWIWGVLVAIVGAYCAYQFVPGALQIAREWRSRPANPRDVQMPPGIIKPKDMQPRRETKILEECEFVELINPTGHASQADKKSNGFAVCSTTGTYAGVFDESVSEPNYSVWLSITPKQRWEGAFGVLLGMKPSANAKNVWLGNMVEIFQDEGSWCMRYKYIVIENGMVRHETPISEVYKLQKDPTFTENIEIRIKRDQLESINFIGKEYTKIATESIDRFPTPKSMGEFHGARHDVVTGQVGVLCNKGCFEVNQMLLWRY